MQASTHVKKHGGRQTVEYPIRVTIHAIEKLREIGCDAHHSDGYLRDRVAIMCWEHIKDNDPGQCSPLNGNAEYIVKLPANDQLLGLRKAANAVVVRNTVAGDDNATWAVTTILDDASLRMRTEVASSKAMGEDLFAELRDEIEHKMFDCLVGAEVLVVLQNEDGMFDSLRGFPGYPQATGYVNEKLGDGYSLDRIRVYGVKPLAMRVTIGD